MRIRGRHILIALLVAVGAFVVLTTQVQAPREAPLPAVSAPPLPEPDSNVPKIAVATRELRLGTVPNDDVTRVPLPVHNEGLAPLVLSAVKTDCACTQGVISQGGETIAPGKQADITVVFDPRRVFGFHSHKTLTIWSNDPALPQVDVAVIADIDPEFLLTPERADFGEVEKGAAPSLELTLRQVHDEPVEVHDVRPAQGRLFPGANDLQLSFTRLPEPEWRSPGKVEYRIGVALPADAPPGPLQRVFEIHTNVPRVPRLAVVATADVRAPYSVSPAFPEPLVLRRPAGPDTAFTGELLIRGDAPPRVEDIDVPPTLRVAPQQDPGDGNVVSLRVSVAEGAPSGRLDETLRYTVCIGGRRYPERAAVRAFHVRVPGASPASDGAGE